MKNPVKELHYIFYLPGTGGNFMLRLFSLSEDTQFLWIRGSCGCVPANNSLEEKLKWYSFKESDASNWSSDAHLLPYGVYFQDPTVFYNPGTKLIAASHFLNHVPYQNTFNFIGRSDITEKYYYIDVNEDTYRFMNRYLKIDLQEHNTFGGESWQVKDKTLSYGIPVEPIYLQKMLDSDQGFLEEYHRVCALMTLEPVGDNTALEFFHHWRKIRVDNPNLR